MSIYKGSTKLGTVYHGGTKIGKGYKGLTLVYSGERNEDISFLVLRSCFIACFCSRAYCHRRYGDCSL